MQGIRILIIARAIFCGPLHIWECVQIFDGGVTVEPGPLRTAGPPDPATPAASPTRDRVGGGGAHPPLGLTGLGRHKGSAMDDDLDGGLASDDY